MKTHNEVKNARRWVIKIGSSLITADGRGLDRDGLQDWVEQQADLIAGGHEVVLVSSGAVAEGMSRMKLHKRPGVLHDLQAVAAVGQMGLVHAWESCFQRRGLHTAQVLLTHDDLSDRHRYLNARGTLRALLGMGVVPVVNENDAVANEELRFGDNDSLAALVANLIEADLVVLLTDQIGLFEVCAPQHPPRHGLPLLPALVAVRGGSAPRHERPEVGSRKQDGRTDAAHDQQRSAGHRPPMGCPPEVPSKRRSQRHPSHSNRLSADTPPSPARRADDLPVVGQSDHGRRPRSGLTSRQRPSAADASASGRGPSLPRVPGSAAQPSLSAPAGVRPSPRQPRRPPARTRPGSRATAGSIR